VRSRAVEHLHVELEFLGSMLLRGCLAKPATLLTTFATGEVVHQNRQYPQVRTTCVMLLIALAIAQFGCQESQVTQETQQSQQSAQSVYAAVPDWARTGNFSFARWDGGPIEVSKGALSGWPGFVVPDPQVIYATKNLYEPGTVELIERAHVNWIWVTWSNGFSNQTEEPQHVLLRSYIEECHRHGIHVTAYVSIGNIFWEDMFLNVPESRDWVLRINGQPIPYPSANYAAVGRVTRYMANLSLEAWQQYTLGRVVAAADAGADAVVFDNSLAIYGRELLEQFTARALAEARKSNPQILVMSNYGTDLIIAARAENAITSEQGWEPGIFDSPGPAPDQWNSAASFVRVSGGLMVLNAGLLRALWAVSQGVRPVAVEYGNRHTGDRFANTLPPAHQKLALAECAAFHAANEQFHESTTLRELFFGQRPAVENWDAVAQYNAFLQKYAEFYREPTSLAEVAVIVDSNVSDIPFLNTLAARNLIYDVVFESDATSESLERYRIVIAAPSVAVRPGWKRYDEIVPAELEAASPGSLTAPDSVVVNFNGQSQTSRMLVHLLNYADAPAFNTDLKVNGRFATAQLLSPDIDPRSIPVQVDGQFTQIRVPELRVYDLVVLEP
jgi:hypothetical protein